MVARGAKMRCRRLHRARSPNISRSEEHTSELQSLMRISYAVLCLKKKNYTIIHLTSPVLYSIISFMNSIFFYGHCSHRDLHVLTHSFPTRLSSDLRAPDALGDRGARSPGQ